MSQLKLFRQEALKHQYKSTEFSDVVIEPPKAMITAFYWLLLLLTLAFMIIWLVPVSNEKWVTLTLQNSNFQPIISANPVLIEQHFVPSGTFVTKNQALAQVRRFSNTHPQGQTETFYAPSTGDYFAETPAGTTLTPLQPIGRILKPSRNHQYYFSSQDALTTLQPGKRIKIKTNTEILTAKVINLSHGQYQHLGIQFDSPPNTHMFSPSHKFKVLIGEKRRNLFALLKSD